MKFWRDLFFLLLGLLLITWSFYWAWHQPAPNKYQDNISVLEGENYLKVEDKIIPIEIASTKEAREKGLSGRESLVRGTGLLFVFPVDSKYGFWMKGMKFPIDIVWIASDGRVVSVEREINPETYPKVFYPEQDVRYVLELNSGDATTLGIDTGSEIYLSH